MASDMIASSEAPSKIMTAMMMDSSAVASSSSSGIANADFADDSFEDGCSICLEPFSSRDPPTVTSCKHEYHLQCILEWSQRSKECPICWQLFVLRDPASQQLLVAVESETSIRSRSNIHLLHQEHEVIHDAPYRGESDFEEQILEHLAADKNIAHLFNRRRQKSSRLSPSQILPSISVGNMSSVPQIHGSPEECRSVSYGLDVGLPPTGAPASAIEPEPPAFPSADNKDNPIKHRIFFGQHSPDGPRRLSSSELLAFSDSVKAKLFATSSRYKESISKSTRGLKEKLLAGNGSVKELSREVQREVSAGIAGVARMIERFDLSSKRTGVTVPPSSCSVETSNFAYKGKDVEEIIATQPPNAISGETRYDMSSLFSAKSTTVPGQVEVSHVEVKR